MKERNLKNMKERNLKNMKERNLKNMKERNLKNMKENGMKPSRLLLFGLDGLAWDVLDPFIEEGILPTFKHLRDEAVHGTLQSTVPTATMPALPALYTGRNPAELGLFFFRLPSGAVPNLTNVSAPRFWNYTDRAGKRSLVVNLRFTFPPERTSGLMVSGLPLPTDHPKICSDPARTDEMLDVFGERRFFHLNTTLKESGRRAMVDRAIEDMWERYEKFKALSGEESYDVLWYWLEATDFVQHKIFTDREVMRHFFVKLDRVMADVLDSFADCTIIFHSDHGFHAEPSVRFHVNTWLEREGFLSIKGNALTRRAVILMQWFARNYVPSSFIDRFLAWRKQGGNAVPSDTAPGDDSHDASGTDGRDAELPVYRKPLRDYPGIDFSRSRAFMVDSWGIDIASRLSPDDYETTREDLITRMRSARTDDGKPLFHRVWKREELFNGRCKNDLPDIIFLVHPDYLSEHQLSVKMLSKLGGKMKKAMEKKNRLGTHTSAIDGFLAAIGPDIKKGPLRIDGSLLDILPTALHVLGIAIPRDLDGKPLTDMLECGAEPVFEDDAVSSADGTAFKGTASDISAEEKNQMEESLKAMGYLDF